MRIISILSLFALLLVMMAASAQADQVLFPCGYDYFSKAGAWFKMHTQGAYWSEASSTCISEGAHLATPISEVIEKAMMALMVFNKNKNSSTVFVHSQMHQTYNKKNGKTKDLALALSEKGTFKTFGENAILPYICYKEAPQVLELNECGTTDPDYKLDKRTNHCYKFHRMIDNWWSAANTCEREGGDLAIINSEEEAKVIQEILARNPADVIPLNKDSAFLGYWAHNNETWRTLQGQTLSEAGYERWSQWPSGELNNQAEDTFCGSIGRNGSLIENPCSRLLPCICEQKINSCISPK